MSRFTLASTICLTAFAAVLPVSQSTAASFNVNNAFIANEVPDGSEQNPNGNYTYGYSLTPSNTAAMSTVGLTHTDAFNGVAGVEGYFIAGGSSVPAVIGNVTNATIVTNFGVTLPAQELLLHPGGLTSDSFAAPTADAVLRYTTPSFGLYTITGHFDDLATGNTDVHVLINGVSSFDSTNSGAFNITANLAPGAKIDFVVGPSSDGIGSDSTGLFANITLTPEPSSLALCGLGALGLLVAVRNRRNLGSAKVLAALLVLATSLAMTSAAHAGYASTVLADSPIAYYQFGNAGPSGTAVNQGSLGAAANGTYNGTAAGGSITGFYGLTGTQSVLFTAGTSITGSDAGLPSGNAARTFTGWINTSAAASTYRDIYFYGSGGTGNAVFTLAPPSGTDTNFNHANTITGNFGESQYGDGVGSTKVVTDGAWHFVAFTATPNGVNSASYSLYVDGVLDGTKTMQTNTTLGGVFEMGNDTIGPDQYLGKLAQVAVFNTALDGGQIAALFQAAQTPEPASLVLCGLGFLGLVWAARRHRRTR